MYADENFNDGIAGRVRPTATGFSIVNESENDYNESGSTYIYMAIRRPNKPPTAATEVFAIDTGNGSSTFPAFDSGFPVDLALYNIPGSPNNKYILSRLTGRYTFITNLSNAAFAENDTWRFESNVGWGRMSPTSSTYSWMFRRAPGFTDVVDYEGSNSATQNVIHNLTVAPELMIIKKRNATEDWHAYSASLGAGKYLKLNSNTGEITNTGIWNNTSPTSSVFTVGNNGGVNEHGDNYIALLFATLPGISKVGSYSGNGTARTIDCGFTNGARFVLIKRTDAAGSWLLFDTLRGISAGNDPFLQLNLTDAQYTSLDVIDPHSSGFNLTSSTAANNGGSEYIFFAIA
jgi:hypothetical protein